jgi:hypothetical protein
LAARIIEAITSNKTELAKAIELVSSSAFASTVAKFKHSRKFAIVKKVLSTVEKAHSINQIVDFGCFTAFASAIVQ